MGEQARWLLLEKLEEKKMWISAACVHVGNIKQRIWSTGLFDLVICAELISVTLFCQSKTFTWVDSHETF